MAVGLNPDGDGAAVWTSPDGLTWTVVPPTEIPGGGASLRSVTSVGSQLVAVGSRWTRGGDSVVLTSDDGATWTQSGILEEGIVSSVVATENGLIAVGEEGSDAAVWVATQG